MVEKRFADDDGHARPPGSAGRDGDAERKRPSASSGAAAPETADAGDGNPHPVANAVIMLGVPVGVVGLIFVLCTNSFMATGFGIIIGVLTALVFAIGLGSRDLGPDGRTRRLILGVPALLVLTASVAVSLSTIMGVAVRLIDPADYHGRYGTKVEAHIPDTCHYYRSTRRIDADITCDDARWELNGTAHSGTIVLGWHDITQPETSSGLPETVEAYVIGDKGYSVKRIGRVENVAVWGAVPIWPLPVALVLAALAAAGLARARWFGTSAPDQRSASAGPNT